MEIYKINLTNIQKKIHIFKNLYKGEKYWIEFFIKLIENLYIYYIQSIMPELFKFRKTTHIHKRTHTHTHILSLWRAMQKKFWEAINWLHYCRRRVCDIKLVYLYRNEHDILFRAVQMISFARQRRLGFIGFQKTVTHKRIHMYNFL